MVLYNVAGGRGIYVIMHLKGPLSHRGPRGGTAEEEIRQHRWNCLEELELLEKFD
jgi:hypothetical protein